MSNVESLATLASLGFDHTASHNALEAASGNLEMVVELLLGTAGSEDVGLTADTVQQPPTPPPPPSAAAEAAAAAAAEDGAGIQEDISTTEMMATTMASAPEKVR